MVYNLDYKQSMMFLGQTNYLTDDTHWKVFGTYFFNSPTVQPRFNEVAGDWPNLFVKSRVPRIENLYITNLREKDQNVRYTKVIVNDWFVTQVTSVEIV